MCCSYGVVSRTRDPFLSLLPPNPSLSTMTTTTVAVAWPRGDPFVRLFSTTQPSRYRIKAASGEGFVAFSPETMSFYELLGISETGTLGDIKQAYKQLARKYHPDVSPPDRVEEYTRRFIWVQQAYETLSDPKRRCLYDRDMARGLHLAFSARRRYQSDEQMEERSEWKSRWQVQLSELKRRSINKETQGNMSWGARMRKQRHDLSAEL
ncbi:hypothetical protein NMG60_11017326 [Bertholletia excelsa]